MADPIPYQPAYSFTGFQSTNPSKPLPAPRLDDELANISSAINGAVAAVKDVRRADGKLQNGIVTSEALSAGLAGQLNGASANAAAAVATANSALALAGVANNTANTAQSTANQARAENSALAGVVAQKADQTTLSALAASLGSAAFQPVTAFATAAQGGKANTAVQPGDLATVATTGKYDDLSGKPVLGTAASHPAADFATAAQGSKADTALQSIVAGANISINVTDPRNPIISSVGGGSGGGDVFGPTGGVADNEVVIFDGVTGKLIKSGGVPFSQVARLNRDQTWTLIQRFGDVDISGVATIATRPAADNTTRLANTAFVQQELTAKFATLGTAAVKNTGTGAGQVPLLDAGGKLDVATLPAVAITDTFIVNSQAAMLALVAQRGDVCIRSDLNKSFILATDSPTVLADWKELLTPTDAVLSVAGLTGAITSPALKTALGLSTVASSGDYGDLSNRPTVRATATAAEYRAAIANRWLGASEAWAAAAPVAVAYAASIALDLSTGINFSTSLTGNLTLANPTNVKPGQSGYISLKQDATGSRTITYGSNWKFESGSPGVLTTTAGAWDKLVFQCEDANTIHAVLVKDLK